MDVNFELQKYAAAFAYSLIKKLDQSWLKNINAIILFGSVAQGRASAASDVDIFIDAQMPKSKAKKLKSEIRGLKEEFLLSSEALLYKARGTYSDISVIVGDLSEWEEMKRSVSAGGIVLFGAYVGAFKKDLLRSHVLFFWKSDVKNRGAFLNKIYGYRVRRRLYIGVIQRLAGIKVGRSSAIIPSERAQEFMKILENYGIKYKAMEIFT